MVINWDKTVRDMLRLVDQAGAEEVCAYNRTKLLALTRYLAPHHFENGNWDFPTLSSPDQHKKLIDCILALDKDDRVQLVQHVAFDLQASFPKEVSLLLEKVEPETQLPAIRREKNMEKLNRYLMRIDGAIHPGRYTLALHLTSRCLREYYRAFSTAHQLPSVGKKEEINLMSVSVCRYILKYFRKYRIPFTERRVMLMTTVTNVLFTTVSNLQSTTGKKYAVDKAIALYARNNVQRIARYLSKYF